MAFDRTVRIDWRDLFGSIGPVRADETVRVEVEREVIPIVFVPGIMGSRLKRMRPGPTPESRELGIAWEPEVTLGLFNRLTYSRGLEFYRKFGNKGALYRKSQLIGTAFDPDYLEVVGRTPGGDVDEADRQFAETTEDVDGAFERGWAGVSMATYGSVLRHLSTLDWSEPIRHCFDLPVHAFGYNWSGSNVESGRKLVAYARKIVGEYVAAGRTCERVILVTHSMGGLVARAACHQLGGDPLVLGVVHGVQPSSGAPNAYWRMKGGFAESTISIMLGKTAEEVTPLLGHMPGGLQLLPNKRYRAVYGSDESPQWLRYTEPTLLSDAPEVTTRLPQSDPYREIYRVWDKFYRLCDSRLLDPGGLIADDQDLTEEPWSMYLAHIDEAERYHDVHQDYAHTQTVQFYSDGVETQTRVEYERTLDTRWHDEPGGVVNALRNIAERIRNPISKTDDVSENKNGFRVRVTWNALPIDDAVVPQPDGSRLPHTPESYPHPVYFMTLQPADGEGDGTVPQTSGRALQIGDENTVRIGPDEANKKARGHEPAYQYEFAQYVTAMAIENFCLTLIRGAGGGSAAGPAGGGPGPASSPTITVRPPAAPPAPPPPDTPGGEASDGFEGGGGDFGGGGADGGGTDGDW